MRLPESSPLKVGPNQHSDGRGAGLASLPPVHLFAFGAKGYIYAAVNLAATIRRYTPGACIVLHTTPDLLGAVPSDQSYLFDLTKHLAPSDYIGPFGIDPGKLKAHLADHFDGPGLYVDVDSACIEDITPLLISLKSDGRPYITEVVSKGPKGSSLEYFAWIKHDRFAEILQLGPSATLYAIQSSWAWIDPDKGKTFFDTVAQIHDTNVFRQSDLSVKWGSSMPDELIYSAACSCLRYDPSFALKPMFFGDKPGQKSFTDIAAEHYFLSLYGNGTGKTSVRRTYIDLYDRHLKNTMQLCNLRHNYNSATILRDKYVNGTAKLQRAVAVAERDGALPPRGRQVFRAPASPLAQPLGQ